MAQAVVSQVNNFADLLGAAGTLGQLLDGNKQIQRTKVDPAARAQVQQLIAQLKDRATNQGFYQQLVDSIIQRSAIDFAPVRAAETASGGYNSTTLQLLQNDAKARAAAEASSAVLNAQNSAFNAAAQLAASDLNASRELEIENKPNRLIQGLSLLLGAKQGYNMFQKMFPGPRFGTPQGLAGAGRDIGYKFGTGLKLPGSEPTRAGTGLGIKMPTAKKGLEDLFPSGVGGDDILDLGADSLISSGAFTGGGGPGTYDFMPSASARGFSSVPGSFTGFSSGDELVDFLNGGNAGVAGAQVSMRTSEPQVKSVSQFDDESASIIADDAFMDYGSVRGAQFNPNFASPGSGFAGGFSSTGSPAAASVDMGLPSSFSASRVPTGGISSLIDDAATSAGGFTKVNLSGGGFEGAAPSLISSAPVASSVAPSLAGAGGTTAAIAGPSGINLGGSIPSYTPATEAAARTAATGTGLGAGATSTVGAATTGSSVAGISGLGAAAASPLSYVGPAISLAQGDKTGAAGQVIGTAIGSILGPVGAAVGGAVGAPIGEAVAQTGDFIVDTIKDFGSDIDDFVRDIFGF